MRYKIGDIVEGEVTGIRRYGAFVALDEQTQGLIHISELGHTYVKDIHEVLKIGDTVRVLVLDVDEYSGKISLSMRALEKTNVHPFSNRKNIKRYGRKTGIGFRSLEEHLDEWMVEAVEYLKSHEEMTEKNKKMEDE